MNSLTHDAGVIQTLMDQLTHQLLPRALKLKERVDANETLGESDLNFLEEVFADAHNMMPMVDRHPEYQNLTARLIHLYKEIIDKAMQNEKKA